MLYTCTALRTYCHIMHSSVRFKYRPVSYSRRDKFSFICCDNIRVVRWWWQQQCVRNSYILTIPMIDRQKVTLWDHSHTIVYIVVTMYVLRRMAERKIEYISLYVVVQSSNWPSKRNALMSDPIKRTHANLSRSIKMHLLNQCLVQSGGIPRGMEKKRHLEHRRPSLVVVVQFFVYIAPICFYVATRSFVRPFGVSAGNYTYVRRAAPSLYVARAF